MKRVLRVVAILTLSVLSISFAVNASAQSVPTPLPAATPATVSTPAPTLTIESLPQAGPVPGVYENFTVGKESGDLQGMRVVIFPAGGGHHAMVQIAEGGAEDPKPVFVDASVRGATVAFTVNDQKYTGTVSIAGITLKDPDGKTIVLKRRPCATLFR